MEEGALAKPAARALAVCSLLSPCCHRDNLSSYKCMPVMHGLKNRRCSSKSFRLTDHACMLLVFSAES